MKGLTFKEIKEFFNNNSIKFISNIDDNEIIFNINSIDQAKKNEIIFFNDTKYLNLLKITKAKACLIEEKNKNFLPKTCMSIILDNPYLAFTYLTNLFYKPVSSNGLISANSTIAKNAKLSKNVQINNFVTIKENVFIDKNVIINENSVIGPDVTINENSIIGPNSSISNCKIGKNCFFKSNVVIGERGFGFATSEKITFQHFGSVLIGDNVHIGSNTSIDRASFGNTVIDNNSRLDNLIQIAHNVSIGKNAVIAGQVGIAGSTKIGDNVLIGGQAGISGHLIIGNNVTIAAKSGVTKNLSDKSVVAGFPAIDIKKWKINIIKFNKN